MNIELAIICKVLTITYLSIYYFFIVLCVVSELHGVTKITPSYTGGISVLIPCFNEVLTIDKTVDSVLKCKRDFDIELIIIDDGIDSATSDYLRSKHLCTVVDINHDGFIPTKNLRSIEVTNIQGVACYIIDKENGRKADALNAGINMAHFSYFLCLDGDSVLEESSLMELHNSIRNNSLALGGRVLPITPNALLGSKRLFTISQVYEYARTFSITRVSYEIFNAVPLLSGAISLFHTDTVRKLNGYNINTKGEDFELTLRLQQYTQDYGGSVDYVPSAIVYTQVPFDFMSIVHQRTRWHQGMMEVFSIHRRLFHKPTRIALVLHHMRLYEKFGCVIEFVFLFTLDEQFIPIIGCFFILGIIYTLYSALKSTRTTPISIFVLLVFGIVFHYFNSLIKFSCLFRKNKRDWGSAKRMEINL